MNKLEQAARQALEALETDEQWGFVNKKVLERRIPAITALREALASRCQTTTTEQAEQSQLADASLEPVAWMNEERNTITWNELYPNMTPLYAAPVRTKDLTDDEIVEALGYDKSYRLKRWVLDDGRVVIAADREKNK